MGFRVFVALFLSVFSSAYAEWFPRDRADIFYEAGALDLTGKEVNIPVVFPIRQRALPAYRVESFATRGRPTKLEVTLRASEEAAPEIVVEGPLKNFGDSTPPGRAMIIGYELKRPDSKTFKAFITFRRPGVYRIIPITRSLMEQKRMTVPLRFFHLKATCTENCKRREMKASTFLRYLRRSGQLSSLIGAIRAKIKGQGVTASDSEILARIEKKIGGILRQSDFRAFDRWPLFPPMHKTTELRSVLLRAFDTLIEEDPKFEELDLVKALKAECEKRTPRSLPKQLSPHRLPGVGYGHFPDALLTPCQVAHSRLLARVFTGLSLNNGSSVIYNKKLMTTAGRLLQELSATRHKITLRNEKAIANFFALTYRGVNVRWPVWMDTALNIEDEPLHIPMGHSQHAWYIKGKDVDAQIMFFLGINGAAFFPNISVRPEWTGEKDIVTYSLTESSFLKSLAIFRATDISAQFLQLNRKQREGLAVDGYGELGVCNDSHAPAEWIVQKTIKLGLEPEEVRTFSYPYLRLKKYDEGLDGRLGYTLKLIKHREAEPDLDSAEYRKDALCRILHMFAHKLEGDGWDAHLWKQMRAVKAEVGDSCKF